MYFWYLWFVIKQCYCSTFVYSFSVLRTILILFIVTVGTVYWVMCCEIWQSEVERYVKEMKKLVFGEARLQVSCFGMAVLLNFATFINLPSPAASLEPLCFSSLFPPFLYPLICCTFYCLIFPSFCFISPCTFTWVNNMFNLFHFYLHVTWTPAT